MKKIFNYQTYNMAGNERGKKGKKRERKGTATTTGNDLNDSDQWLVTTKTKTKATTRPRQR